MVAPAREASLWYGPINQAGAYLLLLTLDQHELIGRPFLLPFRAGVVDVGASSFETERTHAVAGQDASFVLVARDRFGNRCDGGEDGAGGVASQMSQNCQRVASGEV